jgi:hypothetical protein
MPHASGSGTGASGLVIASVGSDGLLARLRLDPRALRLGSHDLAELIVGAVRAAQEEHLAQAPDEPEQPEDPEAERRLSSRLDELEVGAVRDFERLTSALDEVLRRLEDR